MESGSAKNDRLRVTARQVRAQGAKQPRNTLAVQALLSHTAPPPCQNVPHHTLKATWAGRYVKAALQTSASSRTKTLKPIKASSLSPPQLAIVGAGFYLLLGEFGLRFHPHRTGSDSFLI